MASRCKETAESRKASRLSTLALCKCLWPCLQHCFGLVRIRQVVPLVLLDVPQHHLRPKNCRPLRPAHILAPVGLSPWHWMLQAWKRLGLSRPKGEEDKGECGSVGVEHQLSLPEVDPGPEGVAIALDARPWPLFFSRCRPDKVTASVRPRLCTLQPLIAGAPYTQQRRNRVRPCHAWDTRRSLLGTRSLHRPAGVAAGIRGVQST